MMERKGVCCLAPRYGAAVGAGGQASMSWQMGRIMLKFRPIAPKPAAMAPAPVMTGGAGRGKRKAVGRGGGRGRKPKKEAKVAAVTPVIATATAAVPKESSDKDREKKSLSSPSSSSSGMTSVDSSPPPATLPLMPVAPVENDKEVVAAPEEPPVAPAYAAGQVVAPWALRPAASWVTVEDVTGTWRDGEAPSVAACGLWDDAPAFVSDQWGRISWTNAVFNRAVSGGGDDDAAASEVRVELDAKGGAATVPAWGTCAGFTCRVRVRHACPRRSSLVAPCDVWWLDAGGYLWRLDLQAALSLGALP